MLLDEPLNNLDIAHSVSMMKLLGRAADEPGMTVVLRVLRLTGRPLIIVRKTAANSRHSYAR